MFGNLQKRIAKYFWWFLIVIGLISFLDIIRELLSSESPNKFWISLQNNILPVLDQLKETFPFIYQAWPGWLFWALIARFALKLKHPDIHDNEPLDSRRRIIGWIAILILITSFSYNGIYFIG